MPLSPNPAAFAFLANRRSHLAKTFTGPVPSRAALEPILAAALRVPDHGMLTPWRVLVLERAALLRIADLALARGQELGLDEVAIGKGRGQFARANLAVVVISAPVVPHKVAAVEQVHSAGALCMNLVNASEAAGWGANWLTGWVAHDAAFANAAFGCTAGETVAGIIHIGTPPPDEGPDRPRPDPAKVIEWITA